VASIESGQRRVDIIELLELADVLQFDPHELLTELMKTPKRRNDRLSRRCNLGADFPSEQRLAGGKKVLLGPHILLDFPPIRSMHGAPANREEAP
jgi:hypothetical protein